LAEDKEIELASKQESRAIARKPRDAAAFRFGLKFADIHCKFKPSSESQA